jgi:hypothetical protein
MQVSRQLSLGTHLTWIVPLSDLKLWQHIGCPVAYLVSLLEPKIGMLRINLAI